jgi:hypothetical protein
VFSGSDLHACLLQGMLYWCSQLVLSLFPTRTAQLVFSSGALLVFNRNCSASVLQAVHSLCFLEVLNLCSERIHSPFVLQRVVSLCWECSACVLQGMLSLCSQVVLWLVFNRDFSASVLQAVLSLCFLGFLNLCSERVHSPCVLHRVLSLCRECSACVLQGLLSLCSQVALRLCSTGTSQLVFCRQCSACLFWECSTNVLNAHLVFFREC